MLKIYNRLQLKNALRWYFCQAHFVRFELKQNCKPEQKEDYLKSTYGVERVKLRVDDVLVNLNWKK